MHQLQAFLAGQHLRHHTQPPEIVQKICLDMDQPRLCLLHGLRLDTKGQVLSLGQAIVALGKLCPQHLAVFLPDIVEAIVFERNADILFKIRRIRAEVHEGQLEMHGAVKEVQETAPFIENGCFILLLGKLIIDVLV